MRHPPPETEDLLSKLRDASVDSVVQHLKLLHEARESISAATSPLEQILGRADAKSIPAEEILYDLARLSVHNFTEWVRIGNLLVDHLVRGSRERRGVAPDESSLPRLLLVGSGNLGERVDLRFVIENPLDVPAEISFTCFHLKERGGSHQVPAAATFVRVASEALGLRLGVGESGRFLLRLELADPLQIGRVYEGELCVCVGERRVGWLEVELTIFGAVATPAFPASVLRRG